MKRKILLAAALSAVLAPTAFADSLTYIPQSQSVSFLADGYALSAVMVYRDGGSEYAYIKELSPVNGVMSDSFTMPSAMPSGKYIISAVPRTNNTELSFWYTNKTQAQTAISGLDRIKEVDPLKRQITNNAADLGVDTVYFGQNADKISTTFLALRPKTLDDVTFRSTYDDAVIFTKASNAANDTDRAAVLEQNAAALGLDYTVFAQYPQDVKDGVYDRFEEGTITESGTLAEIVEIWTGLERLKNASSWSEYEQLLTDEYAAALGIDKALMNTAYTENIMRALMNNTSGFKTKAKLKEAYEAQCKIYSKKPTQSRPPAGGGGENDTVVSLPPQNNTQTSQNGFSDLSSDHWSYDIVMKLYKIGAVSGSEGRFYPQNNVTRAEFCTMLFNAFYPGEEGMGKTSFTDVPDNSWFAKYVTMLADKGIISGRGDGNFAPADVISREDMAVIIYRCVMDLSIELNSGAAASFADWENAADYSREAVEELSAAGILSGTPEGYFLPKKGLTRAEAAAVIYKVLERTEVQW